MRLLDSTCVFDTSSVQCFVRQSPTRLEEECVKVSLDLRVVHRLHPVRHLRDVCHWRCGTPAKKDKPSFLHHRLWCKWCSVYFWGIVCFSARPHRVSCLTLTRNTEKLAWPKAKKKWRLMLCPPFLADTSCECLSKQTSSKHAWSLLTFTKLHQCGNVLSPYFYRASSTGRPQCHLRVQHILFSARSTSLTNLFCFCLFFFFFAFSSCWLCAVHHVVGKHALAVLVSMRCATHR